MGKVRRCVLLIEDLSVDVVAHPLHAHRPAAQMGQCERRDTSVVLDNLSLGYAVFRKEHAITVGNLDCVSVRGNRVAQCDPEISRSRSNSGAISHQPTTSPISSAPPSTTA